MTWEIQFLDWLQTVRSPFMDKAMVILSTMGDVGALWIALGLIFLIPKKYRKMGIQVIFAMALTFIVGNLILKNVIGRPRPWLVSGFDIYAYADAVGLKVPSEKSFPSGHTMNGITASVTFFLHDKRIGIPAIIVAVLIAFSRMYNYCHYPTDIIGGIVLGLCSAIFTYWLFKKKGWLDKASSQQTN